MKFDLSRELFLPALQAVNNVVERRQSLPILGNILLQAEKDSVTLTATDMEVELSFRIDTAVETPGAITVPGRKLLDICRALPIDAAVSLVVEKDRVRLRSGRSRFTLGSIAAQEFPNIGGFEPALDLELPVDILRVLVESTQFAMAHQDVRYYLNGLLFEFGEKQVRTVATDGHRLAMCIRPLEQVIENPQSVIVPRKGVTEIARLLGNTKESVKVLVGSNHIKVSIPGQELTTKLVDGRFPDYERVIPSEGENCVLATRDELRAGLGRASILSNEKFRGVRIVLSENMMRAIAHNPEQEEAEEEIEIDYRGEEMEVGFNVSYLLDVLSTLKSDKVRIDIKGPDSSCLVRDPEDDDIRYVIMPMRI